MNKLELEEMMELSILGFSVIANQRLRFKVSILISAFKKKFIKYEFSSIFFNLSHSQLRLIAKLCVYGKIISILKIKIKTVS